VRIAERIASRPGASANDRSLVAISAGEKAQLTMLVTGSTPEIVATLAGAVAILEPLVREAPDDFELRKSLAASYMRIAKALVETPGKLEESIAYLRKAVALAGQKPADPRIQSHEEMVLLAEVLTIAGKHGEAEQVISEALRLNEAAMAADPSNLTLVADHLNILADTAKLALQLGDAPRAVRMYREALVLTARLPAEVLKTRDARMNVALTKYGLGSALLGSAGPAAGDRNRRLAILREARSLFADVAVFIGENRAERIMVIPDDQMKEFEAAVRSCDEAIARLTAA
jgi:tetratricopeptide (TPR) repeat protein